MRLFISMTNLYLCSIQTSPGENESWDRIGGEKPVKYVNTHGTSTPVGDVMELSAIKTVFDELGYQPWVGSTKSLSGHALGAAGVHEAIYTILMMENEFLAEYANINDLVDEAEGMNILLKREGKGTIVYICIPMYTELKDICHFWWNRRE